MRGNPVQIRNNARCCNPVPALAGNACNSMPLTIQLTVES
ncbi:hypothetical protein GGQ57_000157 [Parabacteroides faecis]|uniref:Uncharacterized protein n=1 Tax=Parabacteroides faecis TaxID=1217282 RepID=A0ABR6KFM4_9BACT|nr:hypothetical protein [Parabacteroides faecis]